MSFQRASILNKIPRNHVKSFKTVDTRASGLHFPTPPRAWSWPWGWYKKIPKMLIQMVGMLNKFPKFHGLGIKAVHARASGLHFPTPFCAWGWPWGWYQKMPIMFIQRANMLNNFPKIQGWGIKTVHARASGLHFPTPFWAWGRPRGGCTKSDLTRLLTHVLLMSYPKIICLGLLVSEE